MGFMGDRATADKTVRRLPSPERFGLLEGEVCRCGRRLDSLWRVQLVPCLSSDRAEEGGENGVQQEVHNVGMHRIPKKHGCERAMAVMYGSYDDCNALHKHFLPDLLRYQRWEPRKPLA